MELGTWADWLSSVSNLIVAAAAGLAAIQGTRSLSAWRSETLGRKKIELAEEVLADFYEARDIFRWIRSPSAYTSEIESRPERGVDEREDVKNHRDTFFVPLKRLSDHSDFFARLRARRYRIIASFGIEAAKPYEELHSVQVEVQVAARTLMRIGPKGRRESTEKYEAIVWEGYPTGDKISERIDALVASVENQFRSEILEVNKKHLGMFEKILLRLTGRG